MGSLLGVGGRLEGGSGGSWVHSSALVYLFFLGYRLLLWPWGVGECEPWGFECERENLIVEVLITMADAESGAASTARTITTSSTMSCNESSSLSPLESWCLIPVV